MANGACLESDLKVTNLIFEPFSMKSAVQRLDETKANYVKSETRCSESPADVPSDKANGEPNNPIKSSAESGLGLCRTAEQADKGRVPLNNNNANLKDLNGQQAHQTPGHQPATNLTSSTVTPTRFASKEDCLLNSLLNSEHNRPLTSIILSNNLNKKFNSNQSNQFLIRPAAQLAASHCKRRPANNQPTGGQQKPNEINLETQLKLLICIDHQHNMDAFAGHIDHCEVGSSHLPTFSSSASSEGPSSNCSRPSSICSSPISPSLHKTVPLLRSNKSALNKSSTNDLAKAQHHPVKPDAASRLQAPKKANKSILSTSILSVNSKLPSLASSLSKTSKAILSSKFTSKVCSKVNSKVLSSKLNSKPSSLASCIRAASPDCGPDPSGPVSECSRSQPANQFHHPSIANNSTAGMRHASDATVNANHQIVTDSISPRNHKSGDQNINACPPPKPHEQPVSVDRSEQAADHPQLSTTLSTSPVRWRTNAAAPVSPNDADDPIVSVSKFTTKNQLRNAAVGAVRRDATRDDTLRDASGKTALEGEALERRDAAANVCTPKMNSLRKKPTCRRDAANAPKEESSKRQATGKVETLERDEALKRENLGLEDHELRQSEPAGQESSANLATDQSTAGDPKCNSNNCNSGNSKSSNNRAIYDNESTGNQYTNQHRGQANGERSDNAVINGAKSSDNGSNGRNEEDLNGLRASEPGEQLERSAESDRSATGPNHLKDQSYAKELNELRELKELNKVLQAASVSRSKSDVGHRQSASRFKQPEMDRVFNTIGLDMARSRQAGGQQFSDNQSAYPNLSSGSFERNPFLHHGLAFANEFENGFDRAFAAGFGSSFSNTSLYAANQSFYPTVYAAPYGQSPATYPSPLSRELSNGLAHYYSSGSQLYCNLSTVDSSYYTIDSSPKQALSADRVERSDKIERFDQAEQQPERRRPDNAGRIERSDSSPSRIDKSLKNEKQSPSVYFKANQEENTAAASKTNQLINLTKSFNSMQLNEFKTASMSANGNQLSCAVAANHSANLLLQPTGLHSTMLDSTSPSSSNLQSAATNRTTNLIANPGLATSFNSVGLPSRPPTLGSSLLAANGLPTGALPAAKISQQLIKPNNFKAANLGLPNAAKPSLILADHHDGLDGEISIIERNARVIKWLYNSKKYYESAA